MSKQISLLKYFGSRASPSKKVVFNEEVKIKKEVSVLLKYIVKNVVDSEASKTKAQSDDAYSITKERNWKKRFTFWNTKDGKVIKNNFLFIYFIVKSREN